MKRYSDNFRLAFLSLLWHIFQESVLDVGFCKSVQVAHSAADITMEHENVTDNRQFRIVVQVCIVQNIPLFRCKVERVAVCRLLAAIERIDLVV